MTTVSVSTLKINPGKVLDAAQDYPVAVAKRAKIQGYLLGGQLYEKLLSYVEDHIDKKATKSANFNRGKNFDKIAGELGL